MDYGHELLFGSFITPAADRAARDPLAGPDQRPRRARPRQRPGPPVPAAFPRHLDLALRDRRADRAGTRHAQRRQPAPAPAGRPRPQRRHSRRPQRRPGRARAGRRGVLDRDRRDGRPTPERRRKHRGPRRRHPDHPRDVAGRRPGRTPQRAALPALRGQARPGAGPRCEHLDRRLQAQDASPDRPDGRRMAAQPRVRGNRRNSRHERCDRRGRRRRRPVARRHPPLVQHQRRLRQRRRFPAGPGQGMGRAARRADPDAWPERLHPGQRRPR